MARQISELSNEDFSLLETSAHLPTISLPDQIIEAQLAAVLERLKQEVYFSDSGTVSDLDGPAYDGAGSQHDNLSSEADHPPQSGTSSEQQCNESCHDPTVGEARQETCKPSVARQQASSESGPNSKPVKMGKDVIKKPDRLTARQPDRLTARQPDRLTARQPANQQRVIDLGLQTRFFHPQENSFDSTLMVNHQSVCTAPQKGRQRKRRRKPCAAHVQRTTIHVHYGSPLSDPDPEDRISASFNHQEVVNFLWQGEATQNNTAN